MTLPEGFSINPNAADGKTDLHRRGSRASAPRTQRTARSSRRSAPRASTARRCRRRSPDTSISANRRPGNRYRVILTADGFATHIKLAGSVHPDPQTGQLTIAFHDLPQSPLTEFNLHFFGSERGAPGDPDAVRHLRGPEHLHPLGRGPARTDRDPVLHPRLRPDGCPLPELARGRSRPASRPPRADNTAGAHSPFARRTHPPRRRPEPQRPHASRLRPASRRR